MVIYVDITADGMNIRLLDTRMDDDAVADANYDCDYDHELIEDIRGRMILHWNYRALEEIPEELLQFGNHVLEIYLKYNKLSTLPPRIKCLENLTNLYLSNNSISSLPEEIGCLRCLKTLDIGQNALVRLPTSLGQLGSLEQLILTRNQIRVLPLELGNLRKLKFLELSGNQIGSLSSELTCGLKSLEEFSLDGNPIGFLPRSITSLKKLWYVSVCRCKLLYLPATPFYRLLYHRGKNNPGKGSRSSRVTPQPYHPDDFDESSLTNGNFTFLCDNNPQLNHLPYWAIQLLGRDLDCYGCSSPLLSSSSSMSEQINDQHFHPGHQSNVLIINLKEKDFSSDPTAQTLLHLDQDLIEIHKRTTKQPPSLLELSLRAVSIHDLYPTGRVSHKGSFANKNGLKEPSTTGSGCLTYKKELRYDGRIHNDSGTTGTGDAVAERPCSKTLSMCKRNEYSIQNLALLDVDSACCKDVQAMRTLPSSLINTETTLNHQVSDHRSEQQPLLAVGWDYHYQLPKSLDRILILGPLTRCFQCLKPIFTQTWLVVFNLRTPHLAPNAGNEAAIHNENNVELIVDFDGQNANLHLGFNWALRTNNPIRLASLYFCSEGCISQLRNDLDADKTLQRACLKAAFDSEIHSWKHQPHLS